MKAGVWFWGLSVLLASVSISEAFANEFELAPLIVTANRDYVSEMETPASVQVVTKEDIETTGARNIYEALRFVPGIYFNSWGAKGLDFGSHNTTLSVRGVDQGASVILNGVPITANNFTQLSSIDKNSIERIEVVKGAAAVLYGAETMTGVINIITKKGEENLKPTMVVEGAWGTRGNNDFHFGYSDSRINAGYSKKYIGAYSPTTDTYWGWFTETDVYGHRKKSTQENIYINCMPTNNLSFMYNRSKTRSRWGETAANSAELMTHSYDDTYNVKGNNWIIAYDKNNFKANAFLSDRAEYLYTKIWDKPGTTSYDDYKTKRYGADAQKTWNLNDRNQIIAGLSGEQEKYTELVGSHEGKRTQYAGYFQYTWKGTDRYKNVFGVRFQHSKDSVKTYNEWIPQWQQLYKLSESEAIYSNVGKSFILPRLYDYFYTNIDKVLQPESGWNYELGYKLTHKKDVFRAALFYIDVQDKIKVLPTKPKKTITNVGRFKNKGFEFEYRHKVNYNWNWKIGATYADPKNCESEGKWEQTFPKLQISGGINYSHNKWDCSLDAVHAAKRPHRIKNVVDVSMHVGYKMSSASTIALDVYNLLNRKDVSTEWDWVSYYGDPRTLVLSYRHTF